MTDRLSWENFESFFGGWGRYMRPVVESKEMYELYQFLKQKSLDGEKIFPSSDNTFKAFELCDPHFLKIILIGMEPYSGINRDKTPQASGIALDCSNNKEGILQPSLHQFFEGISDDLGERIEKTNDIQFIAKQGVLLLNRSLTVFYRKIGSNVGKWDFFYKFFFEEVINPYFTGIPIILMGKDAAHLKRYIFEISNPVFVIDHPSYAARNGARWDTQKVFTKVRNILMQNNKVEIYWDKNEYLDEMNKLPF